MKLSYWMQKWEKQDIKFNQENPNEHLLQYFRQLNLPLQSQVLVPLCGTSIDMIWLAQQGYHVLGIEISAKACKSFFSEHHIAYEQQSEENFTIFKSKNITLFAGDFFKFPNEYINSIDAVYDRAALIALPKLLRQQYTEKLIMLTKPGTPIFLISATYDQNEMLGPPFSVSSDEVNYLYSPYFHIETLYDVDADHIPPHLAEKGLTHASEQVYLLLRTSKEVGIQNNVT